MQMGSGRLQKVGEGRNIAGGGEKVDVGEELRNFARIFFSCCASSHLLS